MAVGTSRGSSFFFASTTSRDSSPLGAPMLSTASTLRGRWRGSGRSVQSHGVSSLSESCGVLLLCGTGAQISPVIEVDRRPVGNGKVGEFTQELQNIYFGAVRGDTPKYKDWTIPIY